MPEFDLDVDLRPPKPLRYGRVLIDRRDFSRVVFRCQGMHIIDDWYYGTVWGHRRNDRGNFFIESGRIACFQTHDFFQFQSQGDSIQ